MSPPEHATKEKVDPNRSDSHAASLFFSAGTRFSIWALAALALVATFFAYDQVALAVNWIVVRLC